MFLENITTIQLKNLADRKKERKINKYMEKNERENRWCILKYIEQFKMEDDKKIKLPPLRVVIVDHQCEVWEFDSETDAENMKEIFSTNSDSGHIYEVKKI